MTRTPPAELRSTIRLASGCLAVSLAAGFAALAQTFGATRQAWYLAVLACLVVAALAGAELADTRTDVETETPAENA